jgi:hypothetical protein
MTDFAGKMIEILREMALNVNFVLKMPCHVVKLTKYVN